MAGPILTAASPITAAMVRPSAGRRRRRWPPPASLAVRPATAAIVERVDVLGYHRLGREKYAELGRTDRLAGVPAASPAQDAAARDLFRTAGLDAV